MFHSPNQDLRPPSSSLPFPETPFRVSLAKPDTPLPQAPAARVKRAGDINPGKSPGLPGAPNFMPPARLTRARTPSHPGLTTHLHRKAHTNSAEEPFLQNRIGVWGVNRGGPGRCSNVVGGFPQAVYADIRGLLSAIARRATAEVTAFFLSTVAVLPLIRPRPAGPHPCGAAAPSIAPTSLRGDSRLERSPRHVGAYLPTSPGAGLSAVPPARRGSPEC